MTRFLRGLQLKDMQRVVQRAVDYRCPCSWWCVQYLYRLGTQFWVFFHPHHDYSYHPSYASSVSVSVQWSSIVDTRSVPSLLVPSPLDGVLYAEAGWPAYLLEIQTSCYSENRCQSVLWQRIIPIIRESFPPRGSHFRLRRQ